MSEFRNIMRAWKELCDNNKCATCPIMTCNLCTSPNNFNDDRIKEIENLVIAKSPMWIKENSALGTVRYACSKCNFKAVYEYNYCPQCGNKMLKNEEEAVQRGREDCIR